ncbi:MAG: hypothetical protein M1824_005726 [Vezdaea acicularis]|nr:MAG: hypothetical protein M1824_005726 [Vezdaea acicularis]
MGDAEVKASQWRHVEVGRVVLFTSGAHHTKLATIVEIIDHKRVLVDGPSKDPKRVVPRHAAPLAHIILTPIVIEKLPRSVGTGPLKTKWEEAGVDKKWEENSWAKKRKQQDRRKALTDFERFKVLRLKKQSRFEIRKSLAKVRASAKA